MAEAMHFWSKLLESCKQAHCQPRPSLGHNMASAPSDWHQVGYCLHSGLVCALLQHFTQTSGQLKAEFGQCPSFHLLQAWSFLVLPTASSWTASPFTFPNFVAFMYLQHFVSTGHGGWKTGCSQWLMLCNMDVDSAVILDDTGVRSPGWKWRVVRCVFHVSALQMIGVGKHRLSYQLLCPMQ